MLKPIAMRAKCLLCGGAHLVDMRWCPSLLSTLSKASGGYLIADEDHARAIRKDVLDILLQCRMPEQNWGDLKAQSPPSTPAIV